VREECCDDLLLGRQLTQNEAYCNTLIHAAKELRLNASLGAPGLLVESLHPLGHRLARLADTSLRRSTRLSVVSLSIVTACGALLLPGLRGQEIKPAAGEEQDAKQWKAQNWFVDIKLNAPNLAPPAVQWAIVEHDPVPEFKGRLTKMRDFNRKQLNEAADPNREAFVRASQMSVHWDLGFRTVTGDELYLLVSAPGHSQALSSDKAAGKKWLFTKVVLIGGTPVCWCIPIHVELGKVSRVVLTETNTFDLENTYDEVMQTQKAKRPADISLARIDAILGNRSNWVDGVSDF